jgi:hypothetical protein
MTVQLGQSNEREGRDGRIINTANIGKSLRPEPELAPEFDLSDHETDKDLTVRLGPAINGSDPYLDEDEAAPIPSDMPATITIVQPGANAYHLLERQFDRLNLFRQTIMNAGGIEAVIDELGMQVTARIVADLWLAELRDTIVICTQFERAIEARIGTMRVDEQFK